MTSPRNIKRPGRAAKNRDEVPIAEAKDGQDDGLKLENQVCFPLYAASRLIVQLYKPHLDKLQLTYPQYLVMMVLWGKNAISVKLIGELLYLDSATLTQILGNLEKADLITRTRTKSDARTVINALTAKGQALKIRARSIPIAMSCEFADRVGEVAALRPALHDLVKLLAARLDGAAG